MKTMRATIRVRGLVQGVSYRYFTRRTALELGLTGWVRNLQSGDVEALFEGREQDIRSVLQWCQKGPLAARVDEILVDWEEGTGEFSNFEVHR